MQARTAVLSPRGEFVTVGGGHFVQTGNRRLSCQPFSMQRPRRDTMSLHVGSHEIKHDGFRLMARRERAGIRLITRRRRRLDEALSPRGRGCEPPQGPVLVIDREVGCAMRTGVISNRDPGNQDRPICSDLGLITAFLTGSRT